jgi:hypothetical protein
MRIQRMTTRAYAFTLWTRGADMLADENLDALFRAGCDDATLGARSGEQYAAFDREAASLEGALASAIHDLTRALPQLTVTRVERS